MKRNAAILAIIILILALSACDLTVLKGQGLGEPGRSVLEPPTATSPASEAPPEASPISEGSSGATPQEKSPPAEQTSETAPVPATGTSEPPLPSPTAPAPVLPEALAEARMAMATALNASPEELELVEIEAVEWPDGCLGQSLTGLTCTMVITPGYRGVVRYGEQEFSFRSNLTGTQLRLDPNAGQPLAAGETPEPESAQTTQVVITLVMEHASPTLPATPISTIPVTEPTTSECPLCVTATVQMAETATAIWSGTATATALPATITATPTAAPTIQERPVSSTVAASSSEQASTLSVTPPAGAGSAPIASPAASGTAVPTPGDIPVLAPETGQTVKLPDELLVSLGYRLSVAPGHVRVETANTLTWEDLCFGYLSVPQDTCPAQPTEGYEGSLEALTAWFGGNPRYAYRSDEIGQVAYLTPEAALIAQAALAANLGVQPKDVLLLKVEPWSWPDTCSQTPVPAPGALCVKVPLPGWRVLISVNGVNYIYHTSLNGQVLQLVEGPPLK